ncbi:hypothetical protein PEX1_069800 [Penicillium expansum]|uniref:Uncharacterized protein n=1 Tax=Penicillium expansum TaxID=27334 RepID=A0A0A2KEA0_PENEN|nr:hypothetical protein PEX2_077160 [Penicillium expansum]KGO42067.1 hypothetical protein PEXP_050170 [Penicillium expansum]KGO56109.1 hypothetical protein PEX2_077160 [Penicillium expansum]KGO65283.1 hypothetical protein PEX1_069800 [Penicillium expansum]
MDDAQATAKWANRVLRPLTSICRRIAKHKETLSMIVTESKLQETTEGSDLPTLEAEQKPESRQKFSGSDADLDENDPAWIPGKKPERRRPRHKYSSKAEETGGKKRNRLSIHSPEALCTLPGAIEVATPLITGRRWEMPSSAQSERPTGQVNPNIQTSQPQVFRDRYSLHKSPWQELLDQSGDPGFADIAHNLDRVFQNFLCNTMISKQEVTPVSESSRRGARSLLSMVARSLPEFIASEQEAQDELDKDGDEDMCDAYFTELEAFYAPQGTGWKPLREAVRAQGIYLVSTLIQNHWITDSIACALIEKCRSFSPEESDSLLSTLLSTRKNYPYPQALRPVVGYDPSDPIRLLRKYAHHGVASRSYVFDELAKLLLRGVLPPEWMGTKLWTSWMTRATISLSKEDEDCPAATRLIEAVILSASDVRPVTAAQSSTPKYPAKGKTARARATRVASTTAWEISNIARPCPLQVEDALSNHVISLMAAVCGMHISRSRASDDIDCADGTKASYITNYLQIALQRELGSNYAAQRSHNTPHQLLRRGCILLATSLVKCNNKILLNNNHYVMTSTASVDECAEIIASHSDMVRELALFVHQAFRCLKKRAEDEIEHTSGEIRDMISQLGRVADAPALSTLLGRVAAEAAMEFAEATGDPDDHMWAMDVQEVAATKQLQEETAQMSVEEPEQSSQGTGLFRWEDSIGEWVASTPATKGKPILVRKAKTPMRMLSSPVPCIASSTDTDTSSPGSARFQDNASSRTSSPPPMATKRTFEDTEISSIRPRKRQRPTPVVVVDRGGYNPEIHFPTPTESNSTMESDARRGILRERSTNLTRPRTPATQQARKVEVVIINHKESSPRQPIVRPTLERAVKQVHRTVERRRSTRPSVSSTRRIVEPPTPRQTVIPCYQDDDSDDELSFF